ncbi:hypothetical protein Tco_0531101 [Tanacetum coccineum]
MVVRVPPTMSPGFSASMAEVATMSDSAFRKRFRFSYESSPSSSPPDLPSRKHYQGTSKLVEDDNDEEEDEEMKESLDSNSLSEGTEDEGPTTEDEDPAAGDEGLAVGNEGPGMGVESLSLGWDDDVPRGQQWAALVAETTVGEPLRLGYEALRRHEIALGEGRMPSVFKTPPSPEWSSGLLLISPAPSIVPSPISSPMISLNVPSLIALPAMAETEGFLTELGARVEMQRGLMCDHTGENRELRLQLAEERHARLELAEIVDGMRRGQGPIEDV